MHNNNAHAIQIPPRMYLMIGGGDQPPWLLCCICYYMHVDPVKQFLSTGQIWWLSITRFGHEKHSIHRYTDEQSL